MVLVQLEPTFMIPLNLSDEFSAFTKQKQPNILSICQGFTGNAIGGQLLKSNPL